MMVHLITTINRGGAENFLIDLLEATGDESRITVAYLKGDGYWEAHLRELGISVVNLGMRFYGDFRPLYRLRRLIKSLPGLTEIYCHMPPAEIYGYLTKILFGGARISFIPYRHNTEPFLKGVIGVWLCRRISCSSRLVISSSKAVSNYYRRYISPHLIEDVVLEYGINVSRIRSLALVHCPHYEKWKEANGIRCADGLLIVTICRLVPQKDVELLIRAFSEFNHRENRKHRLVIVGDGVLGASLRLLSQDLGVEGSVHFTGHLNNPYPILAACDVFVLSTNYEGFGLVVLEAMALDRPILASGIEPLCNILSDGEDCLLFTKGDRRDLVLKFEQMNSRETRMKLASRHAKGPEPKFQITQVAKSFANIRALINGNIADRCSN